MLVIHVPDEVYFQPLYFLYNLRPFEDDEHPNIGHEGLLGWYVCQKDDETDKIYKKVVRYIMLNNVSDDFHFSTCSKFNCNEIENYLTEIKNKTQSLQNIQSRIISTQ